MNCAYLQQRPGGVRFTHIRDDDLQAALIDHGNAYRYGNIYVGQVQNVVANHIWIDIGAVKPALLKCRDHQYHQGMQCIVRIKREGQSRGFEIKGPQVVLDTSPSAAAAVTQQTKVPCLLTAVKPLWITYLHDYTQKPDLPLAVYCDDMALFHLAQNAVRSDDIKFILKRTITADDHSAASIIDHYWQDLLAVQHPIAQGGHLLLQETAACSIFDVNTSASGDGEIACPITHKHDRLRFNQSAISAIMTLIDKRLLAGTIFVDFLRLDDRSLQQQLLVSMRRHAKSLKDLKVLGFTPGGWIELNRPVRGPSLSVQAKYLDNCLTVKVT